jgi:Ca2+-binding RTX toxin-like protein
MLRQEVYGLDGSDKLNGGSGDDLLAGGAGNDTYLFGVGSGHDTLNESYSGGPLSTLLMLHDLQNPAAPGADPTGGPAAQGRRVAAQGVHGGVRSSPFVFERTIRVAAVLGLARKPSLLGRLARGR